MSTTQDKSIGFIKRHPDGYAFFISKNETQSDVFISPEDLGGAMSNDVVQIKIFGRAVGNKQKGRVEKIIERHFKQVVGRIDSKGTHFIIKDKSYAWGVDLFIPSDQIGEAKAGELVVVEILSYPETKKGFVGKVVTSLGQPNDPALDIKRVATESGIPQEFEKKSVSEVEAYGLKIPENEIKNRKDLRQTPFVTIDGATAKDFDDAVFVERKGKNFRLVVAIADVSFYVRPNMSVDRDAIIRGTSTYFPNYVIPMLPEGLSNELCSLKPNVDRLALVSDMMIDSAGKFLSYDFYEAVIKSHGRLTYGQVQQVLDGAALEELEPHREHLFLAQDLANLLMEKRFREGSLDLDIPEVLVEVDDQGQAVDIHLSERIFAHRLIEEFMLKANISVAEFLAKKDRAQLYRIHEEPDMLSLDTFMRFFNQFTNFKFQNPDPREICNVISGMEGKEKNILQTLFLRSMSQAKYSPNDIGHFGLAFSHYSHFTSPIRRYPDLIIHRLLKSVVGGTGKFKYTEEELAGLGVSLSALEQRSVKAERKVKSIKKARFAEQLLGQEFEGSITSVAKFGIFVTFDQYPLEGLVRIGDLGADYFVYDEEILALVGQKSKMRFRLGDRVKVKVAGVDVEGGFVDLVLEEHQGRTQSKAFSSWSSGNRKNERASFKKSKSKKFGSGSSKGGKKKKSFKADSSKPSKHRKGPSQQKQNERSSEAQNPSAASGGKIKASDMFKSSHNRLGFGKKKKP